MSRGGSYRPAPPTCSHCHAPVRWIHISATGKRWPCDPEAAEAGTIVVLPDGAGVELAGEDLANWKGRTFRFHFATCPTTQGWRRKRGIPEPTPKETRS